MREEGRMGDSQLVELQNMRVLLACQPVEKVVVGSVGGPKQAQNKAKTLRNRRFQFRNWGLKRAQRSVSTR